MHFYITSSNVLFLLVMTNTILLLLGQSFEEFQSQITKHVMEKGFVNHNKLSVKT